MRLIPIILLVLSFGVQAQDSTQIAQEILALTKPFQEAEAWYMKQEIVMTDKYSGEELDREKTETGRLGNRQYSHQFSEEILLADPYLVKIDNHAKEITVEPYSGTQMANLPLEEYFGLYKQLDFRETDEYKIYYITFKEAYLYKEAEIWVNVAEGKLHKLCMYPKYPMEIKQQERTVKLDIYFSELEFDAKKVKHKLRPERYFTVQGKQLKPSDAYKNYSLINHINL